MRTFISIDIPKEVKSKIKEIQDQLPVFYGKKTELENLHLTLKFLGEIDEGSVKLIGQRLNNVKYSSFESQVKYAGFFDNVKRGKNYGPVWLYLDNCEGLQKKIDETLSDLFSKEKRFMSHLTIARVKDFEDKKDFLNQLEKIKIPKISFKVDSFKLKKSVLMPAGPSYSNIKTYNLN